MSGSQEKIIKEVNSSFEISAKIDRRNDRLWISSYNGPELSGLVSFVMNISKDYNLGKIIWPAKEQDWVSLLNNGLVLETYNSFFFKGKPAFFMVKIRNNTRGFSIDSEKENEILDKALQYAPERPEALAKEFTIKDPAQEDALEMAQLFKTVFESYPTPLQDGKYITDAMANSTIFKVVINSAGNIISAASAEIDTENTCAEITDCATYKEYRGKSLMANLVYNLETELAQNDIISVYSIARSLSPGINITFAKGGYLYGGRFIRNCDICGSFEDMNMWYKKL